MTPVLDASAITAALRTSRRIVDVDALEVESVAFEAIGAGQMASSQRLSLTYRQAMVGAPTSVVAKFPSADSASLAMAAASNAYLREVNFYRDLAPDLGDAVPACISASMGDEPTEFLLLLEDLAPARAVDQRAGCTVDQAASVLAVAADLHGCFWGRATAPWLPVKDVWRGMVAQIPVLVDPWLERFGGYLDPELIDIVTQLGDGASNWLATLDDHRTIWHGDLRLDNVLFEARGGTSDVVVFDWQSAASGPGITDVSYFLGTSLETDVRREAERGLVEEYHRRLISHEATRGYQFEECWLDYCVQSIYSLILVVPVSMGVESTERGDSMFGAMAARAARQMLDLGTLGLVKDRA